jgi:hypothetical protein
MTPAGTLSVRQRVVRSKGVAGLFTGLSMGIVNRAFATNFDTNEEGQVFSLLEI